MNNDFKWIQWWERRYASETVVARARLLIGVPAKVILAYQRLRASGDLPHGCFAMADMVAAAAAAASSVDTSISAGMGTRSRACRQGCPTPAFQQAAKKPVTMTAAKLAPASDVEEEIHDCAAANSTLNGDDDEEVHEQQAAKTHAAAKSTLDGDDDEEVNDDKDDGDDDDVHDEDVNYDPSLFFDEVSDSDDEFNCKESVGLDGRGRTYIPGGPQPPNTEGMGEMEADRAMKAFKKDCRRYTDSQANLKRRGNRYADDKDIQPDISSYTGVCNPVLRSMTEVELTRMMVGHTYPTKDLVLLRIAEESNLCGNIYLISRSDNKRVIATCNSEGNTALIKILYSIAGAAWTVAIYDKIHPDNTPTTEVHDDKDDNDDEDDDVDVDDELGIGGKVGQADDIHSKGEINFNFCDIVMQTHF